MARIFMILILGIVLMMVLRDVTCVIDAAADADTDWDDVENEFRERPGFVGRITQKGFDFAALLGTRILMKQLSKLDIPDIHHKVGLTDVTVSDVTVVEFPQPVARLYPIPKPGYGLRWLLQGINPIITAKYYAEMEFAFWTITKEGTATFTGEDMFMGLDFFVGVDENGSPVPEVLYCKCSGDIDLDFVGEWSDILNVGSTLFADNIRSLVTAQICFQATAEINSKLASQLQSLPLEATIKDHYVLDMNMLGLPTFDSDAVDIPVKGVVYNKEEPEEPPFYPPEIGNHDDHDDRMIYLYATDFLINSALYVTFTRDVLKYDITAAMVPEEFQKYLNTSCSGDICLGTVFPQLATSHPGAVVSVGLSAIAPPRVSVDGATFNVTASGEADVFVEGENATRDTLFTINVNIAGGFSMEIVDTKIFFNVSFIEITCPDASVKESSIGDIGTGFLFESILRVAAQQVLIPRLSEHGTNGVNLPKIKGLEFLRPMIVESGIKDVFVVATDVGYEVKKTKRMTAKRRAFLARKKLEKQRARRNQRN